MKSHLLFRTCRTVLFSLLCLVATAQSVFASTNLREESFEVYEDAVGNLYFKANEHFVLIAADVSVPLFVKDSEDFKLANLGSDNFAAPVAWGGVIGADFTLQNDFHLFFGDLNNDNKSDLIVQPKSSSISNNLIVVYGTTSGFPQNTTVLYDVSGVGYLSAEHTSVSVYDRDNNGIVEIVLTPKSNNPDYWNYDFNSNIVGATKVSTAVTQMGGAKWSLPLTLPKGKAGHQPAVSLNYDSQSGVGLLGMGGSLYAGSSISRCSTPMPQKSGINFNSNDHFCFGGETLVKQQGNTYRTKIDSGLLFKLNEPVTPNIHQNWTVESASGEILKFGETVLAGDNILSWLQTEKVSNFDQSIVYNYTSSSQTGSEKVLNSISYAGNLISFKYIQKSNPSVYFNEGQLFESNELLDEIVITGNNGFYRKYDLRYQESGIAKTPFLFEIQEYLTSDLSQFLKPVNFNWDHDSTTSFDFDANPVSIPTTGSVTFGDHDRDGLVDAFSANVNGTVKVLKNSIVNNKASFTEVDSITFDLPFEISDSNNTGAVSTPSISTTDRNGDGYIDFSVVRNGYTITKTYEYWCQTLGYRVSESGYQSTIALDWTYSSTYTTSSCPAAVESNSNKVGEPCNCSSQTRLKGSSISSKRGYQTFIGDGDSYEPSTAITGDSSASNYSYGALLEYSSSGKWANDQSHITVQNDKRFLIDLHGDSKTTLVNPTSSTMTGMGVDYHADDHYYPLNFNADNYTDLIVLRGNYFRVYLNNGHKFTHSGTIPAEVIYKSAKEEIYDGTNTPNSSSFSNGTYKKIAFALADLNSDGLADSIYVKNNRIRYRLTTKTASGYSRGSEQTLINLGVDYGSKTHSYSISFGDFNADQINDVLVSRTGTSAFAYIYHGSAKTKLRLNQVVDSFGLTTDFSYASMLDDSVYKPAPSRMNAGAIQLESPFTSTMDVVRSITTPENTVYYQYGGGYFHKQSRNSSGGYEASSSKGFTGFEHVVSAIERQAGTDTVTLLTRAQFGVDYPYFGKEISINKASYASGAQTLLGQLKYNLDGFYPFFLNEVADSGWDGTYNETPRLPGQLYDDSGLVLDGSGGQTSGSAFGAPSKVNINWEKLENQSVWFPYIKENSVIKYSLDGVKLSETLIEVVPDTNYSLFRPKTKTTTTKKSYAASTVNTQTETLNYKYSSSNSYSGDNVDYHYGLVSNVTTSFEATGQIDLTSEIGFIYGAHNNALTEVLLTKNQLGDNGLISETNTYDNVGNVNSITTSYIDVADHLITLTYNDGINKSSHIEGGVVNQSFSNFDGYGNARNVTDNITGQSITHQFDWLGRNTHSKNDQNNVSTQTNYIACTPIACGNAHHYYKLIQSDLGKQSFEFYNEKLLVTGTAVRAFKSKNSSSSDQYHKTLNRYDAHGRLIFSSIPVLGALPLLESQFSNSDGTTFSYDQLDRVTHSVSPNGLHVYTNYLAASDAFTINGTTFTASRKEVKWVGDAQSASPDDLTADKVNSKEFSVQYFNALDQLIATKDRADNVVTYVYDAKGQLKESRPQNIDSRLVSTVYNVAGNVTATNDPNFATDTNTLGTSLTRYFGDGKVKQTTSPGGLTTHYAYYENGLLKQTYNQETSYCYDYTSDHNLQAETVFDQLVLDGDCTTTTATPYSYKSLTYTPIASNGNGQVSTLTQWVNASALGNVGGTTTYIYNDKSQLITEQFTALNQINIAEQISYEYDNQTGSINYKVVDIALDNIGLSQAQYTVTPTQIDALGNVTQTEVTESSLLNGLITNRTVSKSQSYNLFDGTLANTGFSAGNISENWEFEYNNRGYLTRRARLQNAAVQFEQSYDYADQLGNRLTNATEWVSGLNNVREESWSYEADGNIDSRTLTKYFSVGTSSTEFFQYNYKTDKPNQLQNIVVNNIVDTAYTYQGDQVMTDSGLRNLEYVRDQYGQITIIKQHNVEMQAYRYANNKVLQSTYFGEQFGEGTVDTVYVAGKEFKFTRNATNVADNKNTISFNSIANTQIVLDELNGVSTTYLVKDQVGTLLAAVDQERFSQGKADQYAFNAFGLKLPDYNYQNSDMLYLGVTSKSDRIYTGHEYAKRLDVIQMQGRMYDPVSGRFLSGDPFIQSPFNLQSYNRYSYVMNNPMVFVDPSGFESKWFPSNWTNFNFSRFFRGMFERDKGFRNVMETVVEFAPNLPNQTINAAVNDAFGIGGVLAAYSPATIAYDALTEGDTKKAIIDRADGYSNALELPFALDAGYEMTESQKSFHRGTGQLTLALFSGGRSAGPSLSRSLLATDRLTEARNIFGFTSKKKQSRNFAIAKYSIDGKKGELFALSGKKSPDGTVGIPDVRQFVTKIWQNTPREFDTEVKLLETLADTFNINSTGYVRIMSELKVCGSCRGVIDQFTKKYGGIDVQTSTGPYDRKIDMR